MKLDLMILLLICSINKIYSQDSISNNILEEKLGYTSPSSTVLLHLRKYGTKYDLIEFDCSLDYNNVNRSYHVISQQSDLIYFEQYFDSTRKKIEVQGYYRLNYESSEIGYCWVKDLVWNFFNKEGILIQRKYFIKGTQKKTF
jgi:hypothetical protein